MDKLERGPVLNRVIQDRIKQYITENRLQPGDLLPPEGQLASDLGVSRGSVREAVKALESLGIVEVRHGDGVRVRAFNLDSLFDLFSYGLLFDPAKAAELLQVRIWLEVAALGDAVLLLTDADLAELTALMMEWEAKLVRDEDVSTEDRAFHSLLYRPLGNESLQRLIDSFWVIYHSLAVENVGLDHRPMETLKAHRDLLDAVASRDVAASTQQLRQHFHNLEARLARAVQLSQAGGAAEHATSQALATH